MSHPRLAAIVAALTLVASWGIPSPGHADESTLLERAAGTYRAVRSDERARARIEREVEQVLDQMYFFKKPFARSKLREATAPCTTLVVRAPDTEVSIQCDDRPPAVSPRDGTATDYVDDDGETTTLRQRVESDRIVQSFESDRGTRTNVYHFDGETIRLSVTIEGDALPEPIDYERTFRRDS